MKARNDIYKAIPKIRSEMLLNLALRCRRTANRDTRCKNNDVDKDMAVAVLIMF